MRNRMVFLLFLAACRTAQAAEPAPSMEQIIQAMDGTEQDYYRQSFDYAMEAVKPGERYTWQSYNSSGYFEVDAAFTRNDTACRNFREGATTQKIYTASAEGVGCKRVGKRGWCRLNRGELHSCALEPPATGLDAAMEAVDEATRSVQRGTVKARSAQTRAENAWDRWWPF